MHYLPNPYDPNPAPSTQWEGEPAAQTTAVVGAVTSSPLEGVW